MAGTEGVGWTGSRYFRAGTRRPLGDGRTTRGSKEPPGLSAGVALCCVHFRTCRWVPATRSFQSVSDASGTPVAFGALPSDRPTPSTAGSGPAPRLSAWLSRRSRSVHAAAGCRSSSTSEHAGTAEITSGWRSLRISCSGPLPGDQKWHPRASTAKSPAPLPSLRPVSIDVRTPPDYDPARQDEQLHHEKNLHAPFVYFAPVGKRLRPHGFDHGGEPPHPREGGTHLDRAAHAATRRGPRSVEGRPLCSR